MVNVGKVHRENKGFTFEGSVVESELIEYCNERGVEIEAFMRIEVQTEDYYEFPVLFNVSDF